MFSYKEVVEALIRQQGLTEGIWAIYIKFGISAANIGSEIGADLHPSAIVPVLELGLQKADKMSNLSVDASTLKGIVKAKKGVKPK